MFDSFFPVSLNFTWFLKKNLKSCTPNIVNYSKSQFQNCHKKEKAQILQVQTTNLVDSKSERVSKMPKKNTQILHTQYLRLIPQSLWKTEFQISFKIDPKKKSTPPPIFHCLDRTKKIGLRSTKVGSLNLMCESPKAFPVLVKGDANLLSAQRTQDMFWR